MVGVVEGIEMRQEQQEYEDNELHKLAIREPHDERQEDGVDNLEGEGYICDPSDEGDEDEEDIRPAKGPNYPHHLLTRL